MSKAGQRYLQEHQDEVEEAIALATAPLIEMLEVICLNAVAIPDPNMANAADCCSVPLEDIDAARALIAKARGQS